MIPTPKPSLLRRLWRVLMTPVGERVPLVRGRDGKRRAPHGIALLTVMVGISLMSVVVTDLGYNEMVRYKLAVHRRDAVKAEALAEGSIQIARLLLVAQSAIQPMLTQLAQTGLPLPAFTVWELIPMESDLMKGLVSGELAQMVGLDVSESLEQRNEKRQEKLEELRDAHEDNEGIGEPFSPPKGGFGAFDGRFSVEIVDEERKAVSLRGWPTQLDPQARFATAQRLYSVIQPERYNFLFEERDPWGNRTDRYELVANIYDWMDANEDVTDGQADVVNWGRSGGGSEEGLYSSYDLEPKDAYFDSPLELRLVRGMTDAHMRAFADSISLYAEQKINILSAPRESIEALVRICADNPQNPLLFDPFYMRAIVGAWMSCKNVGAMLGGCQLSPAGFVRFLQTGYAPPADPSASPASMLGGGLSLQPVAGIAVDDQRCLEYIDTESKNFTVNASATVGDVTRTLSLVLRVYRGTEERYHFEVR